MSGLWLHRHGVGDSEYGPVSLAELRVMVTAGLISEDTRVREPGGEPVVIAEWPELIAALNSPAVREWRGDDDVRIRSAPGALRLGAVAFTRENAVGSTPAPSALDVLAINRACEPERIVVMPPWYRYPFWRNALRWLAVVIPMVLVSLLYLRGGANAMVLASIAVLNGLFAFGWAWIVWVVAPRRWDGLDS